MARLALPKPGHFWMTKEWKDSQGESIDTSISISLTPMYFTRERDFNFILMFTRATIILVRVNLLHSSNSKFSRDTEALANATDPLSETKKHWQRHNYFRLMQPLPIASMHVLVNPLQEVTVSGTSFYRPWAAPMTPLPVTSFRPERTRFVIAFP